MPPPTLPLLDRHRLVQRIAIGGMAEVYLGEQIGPAGYCKRVAIKRLLPGLEEDPRFLELFLDEAKVAAALQHPNLAQIFDVGLLAGRVCMVMEYVEGSSLSRLLKRAKGQGAAAIPPGLALTIVRQACEGLQYAHDFADPRTGRPLGLIHRDVSPHNLLIDRQGTTKVCDFGIAKSNDSVHTTISGEIKGKIAFMAPEQALGQPLDRRADVWSLGIILYELLFGRRPIEGRSEGAMLRALVAAKISYEGEALRAQPVLTDIVRRALQPEPRLRTPSAAALSAELGAWLDSAQLPAEALDVGAWARPLLDGAPAPLEIPAGVSAAGRPPERLETVVRELRAKARPRRHVGPLLALVAIAAAIPIAIFALRAGRPVPAAAPVQAPPESASPPRPAFPVEPELKAQPMQEVEAPTSVTIHLTSQPPGAEVVASDEPGRVLGRTPLDIVRAAGERAVLFSFRLAGHAPGKLAVVPDREQSVDAALPLEPAPDRPTLRAPARRTPPRPRAADAPAPEPQGPGDDILDPYAR